MTYNKQYDSVDLHLGHHPTNELRFLADVPLVIDVSGADLLGQNDRVVVEVIGSFDSIETFWAPRSVDESALDRSAIAFDIGVERTPLQIEEFEQKDRDENAEDPE
ncbi:hypothetical protein ATH50_0434 [Haloplanus aerogenes]|uniref:Uncharacterized protein n=1 Tax=Haloplanus aerogenes TaxID=660522 RepID=A0A3M0DWP8_9EURY|nr:hypothetical protein ATH50_0434 [Haloplanus aerogenes]